VIILFWPHGHGSIPSVGLTADRKPHLEVYKYGTHGYPRKNCRLPADARISIRQIKRTYQVDLGTSNSRVASAKLRNSGSVLDFSRSSCNPGKPPS